MGIIGEYIGSIHTHVVNRCGGGAGTERLRDGNRVVRGAHESSAAHE